MDVAHLGSPEHSQSFADGLWTVQDQAAQLIGAMAEPEEGWSVLDACAGVGGKASQLAELPLALRIDAVDLSKRKIGLLGETVTRLGLDGITPHLAERLGDWGNLSDFTADEVLTRDRSGLLDSVGHRWPGERSNSFRPTCDNIV